VGVRIVSREKIDGDRTWNRWQVDQAIHIVRERRVAREILENPVTARRAGKEGATLTGSYLLVTAAEMIAANHYTDEASRKSFVARVREAAGLKPRPFEEPKVKAPPSDPHSQPTPQDRGNQQHRPERVRE
jgi:hypothetical protein